MNLTQEQKFKFRLRLEQEQGIAPPSPAQEFSKNLLKDAAQNIQGQSELASYAFPPIAAMKAASGQNIYDPQRLQQLGKGMVQGIKETPGRYKEEILHPIKSSYERPITTAMDLLPLVSMGAKAFTSSPARSVGRFVGKQAESLSGLEYKNPKILEKTAANPTKIFKPGKEAANKFYEAAKNPEANLFEGMTSNKEIVDKANEFMKAGAKIEPSEALTARKATDALISKKDSVKDVLIPTRQKLDKIAKSDKRIAMGDKIQAEGIQASELRRLLPVNKQGGTSIIKSTLGTLAGLGPAIVMSPMAQGLTAAGIGALSKVAAPIGSVLPQLAGASAAQSLTNKIKENPKKKLTRKVAKKYFKDALKQVNGNVEEARLLAEENAIKDGFDVNIQ